MEWKDWWNYKASFRPAPVIALLLVLVVVVALITLLADLAVSDWPAWVQAVGSVFAIFVAIWVPARSHAQQQESARLESLAEESRVAWLCECACNDAVQALQEIQSGTAEQINSVRLEKISVTLRGLLTQKLPRRLVNTMFTAITQVERSLVEMLTLVRSPAIPDYEGWFSDAVDLLKTCREECRAQHLELGGQAGLNPPPTQRVSEAGSCN